MMSSPPVLDELDWVPLTNTFSKNLSKREDQDFKFTVSRGASGTLLLVCFSGGGGEGRGGVTNVKGDRFELKEEISFDKFITLHQ